MPLFEFKCKNCGVVFEELVSAEETEAKCQNCGKTATRANTFEKVAQPVVKGKSVDGTGRSYIQDGDYMIGLQAAAAWEKMDSRDNLKRKVMHEHNTTSLARKDTVEVEKSYTGKERKVEKTEYTPLKGESLNKFISGHKRAQKIAEQGGLKTAEVGIPKKKDE